MIVRNVKDIIGTENEVKGENWTSRRVLLKRDGMGFSFHETIIKPGTETHIHYKNHLEAVWCVEGDGEIETVADGKKYAIEPGVVYALDEHDEHYQIGRASCRERGKIPVGEGGVREKVGKVGGT